jgi:hypothetical protein
VSKKIRAMMRGERGEIMTHDHTQTLNTIKTASDEELRDALLDALEAEQRSRRAVGIGPEQSFPGWINANAGWIAEEVMHELQLREHDYVDQGNQPSSVYVN